eukprot:m.144043 g.144043  ORF g.144043 m.144043 type:complete len:88 (+) comp14910_c0_seq2:71-334(+)
MSGDVDVDGYVVAHMQAALKQAQLALDESEVPVGCVIVHPSKGIVGSLCNIFNSTYEQTRLKLKAAIVPTFRRMPLVTLNLRPMTNS